MSKYKAAELNKDIEFKENTVRFRLCEESDLTLLTDFYNSLSQKTKYLRFAKSTPPHLNENSVNKYLKNYHNPSISSSLVVEKPDKTLVAEATYVRFKDREEAEIAIVVHDDCQRIGIGMSILKLLSKIALENGIKIFSGDILPDNKPMLSLIKKTGQVVKFTREGYLMHFEIDLMTKVEEKKAG